MKKRILAFILALCVVLSFAGCGGSKNEEPKVLKVGDTVHGEAFDVTVTSVECVSKIEDGLLFHMWSPAEQTSHQEVTAEAGYAIVKITYNVDYKGKTSGRFTLSFELDYDNGYLFAGDTSHVVPKSETGIGFSRTYTFSADNSIEVNDPLNYHGEDAVAYVIVNDAVITETDKPLVMNIKIPKTPDTLVPSLGTSYVYEQGETETVTFDLRSAGMVLAAPADTDSGAENDRYELTATLVGPNNGLPSLSAKYGNNAWAMKIGDNPVRQTVFFREDINLMPYIGKVITVSYTYDDGNCVDAYIVE